jgi:FixJ family two-component response regulator
VGRAAARKVIFVMNDGALIAVVDDEPPVRTMLLRALRVADYDVVGFASGSEFLDSLIARQPACAIIDVRMPGLSGLEVARQVRARRCPVPLIMITASDDAEMESAAAAAGARCLLRKPFSTDALLVAVHDAVAGRAPAS